MNIQEIQTSTALIRREANGFIRVTIMPGTVETLDDAKETARTVTILAAGAQLPLLVDMRTMKSQNRDARQFYGSPEISHLASAIALLVESRVSMLIANFFISVTKTSVPTRIFNNEPDALAWLKGSLS